MLSSTELAQTGLSEDIAKRLIENVNSEIKTAKSPAHAWQTITQTVLRDQPFSVQLAFFNVLFPHWHDQQDTAPAWLPTASMSDTANITHFMRQHQFDDVNQLHQWSTKHYEVFWETMLKQLDIRFDKLPNKVCDLSAGVQSPNWLPGAELNISNSCFSADANATAIIYQDHAKKLQTLSYQQLEHLSNQVAHSLLKQGYKAGDTIGIAMAMNQYAVAIYLGIIKMGGVVVSIADSFSTAEIHTRLDIAKAKAIFTQDFSLWGNKKIPLYAKVRPDVQNIPNTKVIVIPSADHIDCELLAGDVAWQDFLISKHDKVAVARHPMDAINILFSSGTTAAPKAIVWNHTTPIKAASDAFFHQNIQASDVLAWPTNLGWMMGPWLIFAALINHATIALYCDAPKDRAFGEFVQKAKVTMLGVVPTLVATWRQSQCMEQLDWSHIKVFSSTGECSNPEDMLYLMSLAGYKPVIEYCGGTEIGGGYISSTVIQANYPSLFSTATMGLNFTILDETGQPADIGEVAIIPPSMGLSTQLLNADHKHVYFDNMPTLDDVVLRRHGDQIKRYPNQYYAILGRVDDTMKLGGIKTSAAEIERSLAGIEHIIEVAAIAIQPPDNGPSQLVIFAATQAELDKLMLMKEMQKRINVHLNPLFKIHDLIFTKDLPKTASNKIMRRVLRQNYIKSFQILN